MHMCLRWWLGIKIIKLTVVVIIIHILRISVRWLQLLKKHIILEHCFSNNSNNYKSSNNSNNITRKQLRLYYILGKVQIMYLQNKKIDELCILILKREYYNNKLGSSSSSNNNSSNYTNSKHGNNSNCSSNWDCKNNNNYCSNSSIFKINNKSNNNRTLNNNNNRYHIVKTQHLLTQTLIAQLSRI